MTILFSIPVHESNQTVINTIENARKYNPDCIFVLHVSKSFADFNIGNIDGVLINPIQFDTKHAHSQVSTHITNFIHACNCKINFTHFCILHTSEMYIKNGLNEYIKNLDYSLWFTPETQFYEWNWPPLYNAYNSRVFKNLFDGQNYNNYLGNLIEGSFFSKELFLEITNWTIKNYDIINGMNVSYSLEEVYFPTLSYHLGKGCDFGHPVCCFHHKTHYVDNITDVDDLRKNKMVTFWQPNNFRYLRIPFPGNNLYSIKRINRDLNDPIRSYINSLN